MPLSDVVCDILRDPFGQYEILDSREFAEFLQVRDILVTEEDLETFEREGLFHPLLRLRRPRREDGTLGGLFRSQDSYESYLDAGLIELPEPGDFRPWSEFKDGYEQTVFPFYHPAQTFMIERFLLATDVQIRGFLWKEIDPVEFTSRLAQRYDLVKQSYLKSLPNLEKRISLLILLETPYRPLYRYRLKMALLRQFEWKDWITWKSKVFQATDILTRCKLSVKEVAQFRDHLSFDVMHFDPIANWYMLFRSIRYSKKVMLTGKALRALDHYEYISLLNFFLKDVTGELQPEPDDIVDGSGGSWKKKIYGEEFDLDRVETRNKIMDEFFVPGEGLITKLYLFVEGRSEYECIPSLCHAILWPLETDTMLKSLGGIGGLKHLKHALEIAKREKAKAYVIVDPHPGTKEGIDDLVRERLLEPQAFKIWTRNFEDDNFSQDDMLAMVNEILSDQMLSISREDVSSLEARDRSHWDTLRDAFRRKYGFPLEDRVNKPDLARRLLQLRLKEIRQEVATNQYKPRLEIEKVLRQAWDMIFHAPL
jgi:hypothetical protein